MKTLSIFIGTFQTSALFVVSKLHEVLWELLPSSLAGTIPGFSELEREARATVSHSTTPRVPFTFQSTRMAFLSVKHCKTWKNLARTSTPTQMSITPPAFQAGLSCRQGLGLATDAHGFQVVTVQKSPVATLHSPILGHDLSLLWPTGYLPCMVEASPTSYSLIDYLAPVWRRLSYFSGPNMHQRLYVHNTSFGFNLGKRLWTGK